MSWQRPNRRRFRFCPPVVPLENAGARSDPFNLHVGGKLKRSIVHPTRCFVDRKHNRSDAELRKILAETRGTLSSNPCVRWKKVRDYENG
jgi:hypothetical protein